MKLLVLALLLAIIPNISNSVEPSLDNLKEYLEQLTDTVNQLTKSVSDLGRQTMLQQFAVEERTRTDGDSGIKAIRRRRQGLKNYESPSHMDSAVNSIHDHPNYNDTLGMGEVSVIMNGINFRTRHNDFKLRMPSTTSREFWATEPVPVPGVPPEVQGSLKEQVDEMKEWFWAFKTQNITHRNYTEYFKPVLCYLEGAWTLDKDLREPFDSERHELDASSWFNLQEQLMFTSYTGSKSNDENLAYLPTGILSVNKDKAIANFGQFNYRILCKPIERDIPFSMLKYVDDLAYRMRDGKTVKQTLETRAARFKLYDEERSSKYQILDEIFEAIPGMDNLPFDNLTQVTLGDDELLHAGATGKVPLKTGYYHRQYKFEKTGANGLTLNRRGFCDDNLWVAQTTQSRIAPISLQMCEKKNPKDCRTVYNSFSYALPLELVYLTPLLSWNPHNFTIHEERGIANADGAIGTDLKPFHGVDLSHYYLTPIELFTQTGSTPRDPADTSKRSAFVMDENGMMQSVVASGTKIILDEIPDVGKVRLRYPIAPVSDEGSPVWKELTALKDKVKIMEHRLDAYTPPEEVKPDEVYFKMDTTIASSGPHSHDIVVPFNSFRRLLKGKSITIISERQLQHEHQVKMSYNKTSKTFYYFKCDGKDLCSDGHAPYIELTTRNSFTLNDL